MKTPTPTSPCVPKPAVQPNAPKAPVATAAFRPVQPEDLAAKRRKAYPYLF